MSRPFQPSLAKHACCAAAWLVLLSPVARAADVLQLAPESPDKPWVIPSSAETFKRVLPSMQGDEAFGQGSRVPIEPNRRYSLAELIDIAQRNNPETRVAWEQARRAALAVGLDESEYAPQVSIDVIGGYQRTPLPIPNTVIPAGYFVSDSREVFPVLALKWLLFDFGRREGQDQAARANSFVANVTFTGVHQKLAFTVSRAYFSLGAARGRLSAARRALAAAETLQDAAVSRRERGVATVVVPAQAQRQTAQARYQPGQSHRRRTHRLREPHRVSGCRGRCANRHRRQFAAAAACGAAGRYRRAAAGRVDASPRCDRRDRQDRRCRGRSEEPTRGLLSEDWRLAPRSTRTSVDSVPTVALGPP